MIDKAELAKQEKNLVAAMKAVEGVLDDDAAREGDAAARRAARAVLQPEVFDLARAPDRGRWGIPVRITDVPNPFTGDLDGAEQIHVDHEHDIEDAVFILIHLFGHTVQWNVSESARDDRVGAPRHLDRGPAARGRRVRAPGACATACSCSTTPASTISIKWVSGFTPCDTAYLMHLYRTRGEKRPLRSFWRDDAPLLKPLAIPAFTATQWISRYEGTVV